MLQHSEQCAQDGLAGILVSPRAAAYHDSEAADKYLVDTGRMENSSSMTLRQALAEPGVLISDGAMGTELGKLGLGTALGDEWNLTHPERVMSVHRGYVEAGSQLISTNTFNANRFALARHGLSDKQKEIAKQGASLAKQVMGNGGWVMGSVGPCGGFLEPLGKVKGPELEDSLRIQIDALLEGGVDGILLETMTALPEVEVAVRVARERKAPCVLATCSFDPNKRGPRTMMGVAPEEFAKVATEEGADVIGANCGRLTEASDFVQLIVGLHSVSSLPVIIQPNAGQPRIEQGRTCYKLSPQEMAESVRVIAGYAKIVGGCCGSTPEHIRAFGEEMRTRSVCTAP